uniref:Oskar n=1 Tax=Gryllus bimaculatus TaxID=6999 RepID=K4MTL4_GRYBI|nr:oskar [Gryllus bimaculatus]
MSWTEVESAIKSCVVSKKGVMTLTDLEGEYYELVGQAIPFRTFGCDSLEVFLHKISGVYLSQNGRGEIVITANSKKTEHIANLVKKQKADPKALKKRTKVTYSTPKKRFWAARRNTSRHFQVFNGNVSRARASPSKSRGPGANGYSKFPADRHYAYNSRVSCTTVRYIPAGEELSDDSYGCSPDRGQKQFTSDDHYRTVTFTGGTLRCTVSGTPLPDTDHVSVNINDVEDSHNYSSWDNGPVMLGYHLVGDDFLLQFAYECLHSDYEWDDSERLTCGMCISGQTIHDFHMQVQHEGVIQPKIMLMLGAVDILQNRSLRYIIDDMTDLLDDLLISGAKTVMLLTIPFLKNAGRSNRKVLEFNEFLKTLDDGVKVQVLDVHPLFCSYYQNQTYDNCMNAKCYELSARDVLCYPNGVVLWSHIGRSYLYNFLLQQLTELENTH